MSSLSARLAVVAAAVLVAFLGLTGAALDRAFGRSVEQSVRERLRVHVYLLLGAAEVGETGELSMPEQFTEARFSSPASGLVAAVSDASGAPVWQSASSAGHDVRYPRASAPGDPAYAKVAGDGEDSYYALSYPVIWELDGGGERRLVFQVAQSLDDADAQVAAFRRTLMRWLGAAGVVLLIAQTLVLRWGLAPLRRVAREIAAIERGERDRMGGQFPRELTPLTDSLNALLASGERRLQRYRDALDNLAHSLKTPLAVLRGLTDADEGAAAQRESIREQVDRMDQAIGYHVQRGASAGRTALAGTVCLGPLVTRIGASLDKVYADRSVTFRADVDAAAKFTGDEGDLIEILGNLMDNAYKWSAGRVQVRVGVEKGNGGTSRRLLIEVDDDGPGIPPSERSAVLERGARADELVPGQGLGLALVREMVEEDYSGSLTITDADIGGTRVRVVL